MSATLQQADTAAKDWFREQFLAYQNLLNGHSGHPLAQLRQAAFDEFETQNFPTRYDEDWKYSGAPLRRMLNEQYQEGQSVKIPANAIGKLGFDELDALTLVFVNGVYQEELSNYMPFPEGLVLTAVSKAIEDSENAAWIKQQVAQSGGTGNNTFLTLNRAFGQQGLFIKVARNTHIERPIHCIYLNTKGHTPHYTQPQHFIWAASGSNVTLIESHHSLDSDTAYFTNVANWVDVGANAHVHHYKLQTESTQAVHVNNTIVRQDRDSVYSAYGLDLGGKTVRNNLSTELLNSGTETNLYGVYLGTGQQHIDNQTFIDHAVPHCQSNELYKGIMADYARGVFNGKVLVRQDAQKTNAFQQNSSLVLSPNAVMDAKPQLEIYADDVRCSHGATIGQLDESSVFYLRSRGLPEDKARGLLQQAFVGEVVENFKLEALRDWSHTRINDKLG